MGIGFVFSPVRAWTRAEQRMRESGASRAGVSRSFCPPYLFFFHSAFIPLLLSFSTAPPLSQRHRPLHRSPSPPHSLSHTPRRLPWLAAPSFSTPPLSPPSSLVSSLSPQIVSGGGYSPPRRGGGFSSPPDVVAAAAPSPPDVEPTAAATPPPRRGRSGGDSFPPRLPPSPP